MILLFKENRKNQIDIENILLNNQKNLILLYNSLNDKN
jgi:hypothetical protein